MKPTCPPPPPYKEDTPKLKMLMFTCDACGTVQLMQDPIVVASNLLFVPCHACEELTRIHENSLDSMPVEHMHAC